MLTCGMRVHLDIAPSQVVEAAAFGAPSLMNTGGAVGASELLNAAESTALEVSIDQPIDGLAEQLGAWLRNPEGLDACGRCAKERCARASSGRSDCNATSACKTSPLRHLRHLTHSIKLTTRRDRVPRCGCDSALSWDEVAYGERLHTHLAELVVANRAGRSAVA